MKHESVRVEYIEVQGRWRKDVSEETVARLMESIKTVGGLLHPIAVRYVDGLIIDGEEVIGTPVLVAGRHRLEAIKRLGYERVDCLIFDDEVKAEKWEISENLDRSDLTALERDQHVARWIELTEGAQEGISSQVAMKLKSAKNPKGAGRHSEGINAAARELGIGKDDAHRAVATASIPDLIVEAIKEYGLDDNRGVLVQVGRAAQQAGKTAIKSGAPQEEVARAVVTAAESKLEQVLEKRTSPAPVTVEHMKIFQSAFLAMTPDQKLEARAWIAGQVF